MERLDDVLGYNNLKIFQNSDFFSFSLDSIILANYSHIRLRDKKIVDLCTGNGIVPLILSRRTNSDIIGVEIQQKLCDLAIKSINYNNLSSRISIVNQDVKDFSDNYGRYLRLCPSRSSSARCSAWSSRGWLTNRCGRRRACPC